MKQAEEAEKVGVDTGATALRISKVEAMPKAPSEPGSRMRR